MKTQKCMFKFLIVFLFMPCFLLAQPKGEKFEEFKKFQDKAVQLADNSKYERALLYYDSAQNIADKFKDPAFALDNLRQKSSVLLRMDSTILAIEELNSVQEQAEKLKNDTILAKTLIYTGYAFQRIGMMESVMGYYNRALEIYKKLDDQKGVAGTLNNVSIYYKAMNNYEEALKSSLESYWILKDYPESKEYIRSLINLANVYEQLKEYDTAMSCYRLSYDLSSKLGIGSLASTSFVNMGVVQYRKKNFQEAKEIFLKQLEYYQKTNDSRETGLLYNRISLLYFRLDNIDSAIYFVNKAIDLADETNDLFGKMSALNNLGIYYKSSGRYNEAEKVYMLSIELAKNMNLLIDQKYGYNNLANLYELKGDYKKALEYFRISTEYQDSLLDQTKMKEIASVKNKYQVLMLNDQKTIAELKERKVRSERNITFFTALGIIVLLLWIAIYFRMRIVKNRIISAQRIQQLEDEKRILAAQSVIVGQEEERKRIAQELHDGIGVLLSTASIHFSSLSLDDDPKKITEVFTKATNMLNEAGKEVRKVSHNMMPGVLSKFGLSEAIEDLFETVEETGAIHTELTMDCKKERLPENLEIMIYRIVQEMINNTIKHAKASTIKCDMKRTDSEITIHFTDNGKGFNSDALPKDKSLGIYGIRSRVDFLGGTVNLKSKPGSGTSYEISIPLVLKSKKPKK